MENVFSNRNLEEVHIELPPGFDEERKNGKVRRLRKSLFDQMLTRSKLFTKITTKQALVGVD